MKKLTTVLLLLPLITLAQKPFKKVPEELHSCWSLSFEEDSKDGKDRKFRNCTYTFPTSRFRPSVEIMKDGKCKLNHLGATDILTMEDATWTWDKKKKRVIVINKDKITEMKFRIISISKEEMKVKWEL